MAQQDDSIRSTGVNGGSSDPATPASGTFPTTNNTKSKKAKSKKAVDPSETSKLLAAKISQLESDAAGEKDQDQEIEREVRKATRDLNNLLAGMGTPMERMDALQKKNQELFTDMKRLEREHVKSKKRADQLQKDRDTQRTELTKATSMKEKLEKLAREFTRDNKKLKDDLRRIEDSEKHSREILGARTEGILQTLDGLMAQNGGSSLPGDTLELDELFRHKFKNFIDQYNLRELHFLSLIRTKETEIQHTSGRLESQRKLAESEAARSRQLSAQVSTFSQTETELRSQLNIYVEKFKQVEDTLNNSNDLFLTFRREMEDMSKKTKRLEKENLTLTRKHDLTNRNILEMAEERTRTNKELEALRKKNTTLESVIRRMQEQGRGIGPGPGGGAGTGVTPGGNGNAAMGIAGLDEDGTESDYGSEEDEEDDGEYDDGSDEGEYDEDEDDEDTEEDLNLPLAGTTATATATGTATAMTVRAGAPTSTYGPSSTPPPPPALSSEMPGAKKALINGLRAH